MFGDFFFSLGELISNLVTMETILEPSLKKKKSLSIHTHTQIKKRRKARVYLYMRVIQKCVTGQTEETWYSFTGI